MQRLTKDLADAREEIAHLADTAVKQDAQIATLNIDTSNWKSLAQANAKTLSAKQSAVDPQVDALRTKLASTEAMLAAAHTEVATLHAASSNPRDVSGKPSSTSSSADT